MYFGIAAAMAALVMELLLAAEDEPAEVFVPVAACAPRSMTSAADWLLQPASAMAAAVRHGDVTATELAEASLARIAATDSRINAFTDITARRARSEAQPRPAPGRG